MTQEENRKRELAQEAEKRKAQYEMYRRRFKKSGLGARYTNAFFNKAIITNENKKAYELVNTYAKNPKERNNGNGLYLYGECGTGKTFMAGCIMNSLMLKGVNCKINTIDNIKTEIISRGYKQGGAQAVIDEYSNVDFLVIDDLGTEQFSYNGEANYIQSQLFSIINNRYKNMLPTIYTSNYSLEELQKKGLHPKITDRIFETSCAIIKLEGRNYRL